MTAIQGFLVVLKEFGYESHRSYLGIERVPGWVPSDKAIPGEEELSRLLLEERFGDDYALIPTYSLAVEFLDLVKDFPRDYEIVFVRTTECTANPSCPSGINGQFLGYDVATVAPFYSMVVNWSLDVPVETYDIGPNLLFSSCAEALRLRDDCLADEWVRKEWGSRIYVWEIHRVTSRLAPQT